MADLQTTTPTNKRRAKKLSTRVDMTPYENVIDVIDELNVNVVGKYVVTDLVSTELELLKDVIATK